MISIKKLPRLIEAGVLVGPGQLSIQNIPLWPIDEYSDPDLMLIEVEACGVCGSDYRYFAGENPWAQHTLGRFVPNPPNMVLGHEYAGTVVAVVDEINRRWLGKRVAPICSKVCGACFDCQSGRSHLCANTIHLGHGQGWGERHFFPGAYSNYAPAWGSACYEIPDVVTFEQAAMMDILAVCVHATRLGQVRRGSSVLCIGGGPAGNGIAQAAAAMGVAKIAILDTSKIAREVAESQNVGLVLHPQDLNHDGFKSMSRSGFDTVFDSVGTAETFEFGLSMLANSGTLVNLSIHDRPLNLNLMKLGAERRLMTSCNFEKSDFEKALEWLAQGKFRVDDWQKRISLDNVPNYFRSNALESEKSTFKLVIAL